MKKIISVLLAVLLVLGLTLTAAAAELTSCTVSADSVTAVPGGTVTVPIRIADNPGFTNFAIRLDYDREYLTLTGIETAELCGSLASTNTEWTDSEGVAFGYVTCASAEAVTDNGILFTATFQVSESFPGSATVTPVVEYVRNNTAAFSVFEEIRATVTTGTVSTVLKGDVNGDGDVSYDDVMLVYQAYLEAIELTEQHFAAADLDVSGSITYDDVMAVYQIYLGG